MSEVNGKIQWFDTSKGIGEAKVSGQSLPVFLNVLYHSRSNGIPKAGDVVLGEIKKGENGNLHFKSWYHIDDYIFEVMERTGWNQKEVERVLKGLREKAFAPVDEDYYLRKISPF